MLIAEKNEVWQEKKYLDMDAFKDWAAAPDPPPDKATTSWLWPAKNDGICRTTFTAKKGLNRFQCCPKDAATSQKRSICL